MEPIRIGWGRFFSKLVADSLVLSSALLSSEVWQLGLPQQAIEAQLSEIYGRFLGSKKSSCINAVRHELGVTSQKLRADAAALKFRNYVLRMPSSRLIRRIYAGLAAEAPGPDLKHMNNSVVWFFEPLASKAQWPSGLLSKGKAAERARSFMYSQQDAAFWADVSTKSTLVQSGLENLTCVGSGKLPDYLCDPCPIGLRGGRRLKTKLRLGCHDLNASAYRTLKRSDDARVTRAKLCCNCSLGAVEDFEHILCHCP